MRPSRSSLEDGGTASRHDPRSQDVEVVSDRRDKVARFVALGAGQGRPARDPGRRRTIEPANPGRGRAETEGVPFHKGCSSWEVKP